MYIDFGTVTPQQAYFTMTQTIIPRPIAWIVSENTNGSINLAPFSYFNAVSSNPPLVMISAGIKPGGVAKDTLNNIRQRKDFVLHIVSLEQLDAMNQSSANLPSGESEVEMLGLETVALEGSRLPRLADAKVAFACRLYDIHYIGSDPQALILGQVEGLYVDDSVVGKDDKGRTKILAERINPIGRLGANEYVTFGERLSRDRPK
ncbi:MAG: flavin reductase family protein [Arenicellales bacterium]|jgi:flavin reductase (DIM6/NTAB) family NADH-FMN oxidoreductase RutF|nr:flavin reductase family protein [Arenicellales bacterium]MDP6288878.1 flavin reductase family protein [Arenicellales bacterium]MDP7155122.1 flavin reductase family protein [Arenicellales bacterium]MDP7283260.1 flavin reductase family protein [Arenicellales bacterium]MDP7482578.1 flavin reductase family protein [Arenicellales bacterium]|tara:strand:+ start:324 stop:938 length:615 start_codon:yes stop_codon:yes gene_type:complete